MATSTDGQLMDALDSVLSLGAKIEKANADLIRAQKVIDESKDEYNEAVEKAKKIAENIGRDIRPYLAAVSASGNSASSVSRSTSAPGTTRGKNPAAIIKALNDAGEPLSLSDLIEKAQGNGGGTSNSLTQAINKLYTDGKITRTGSRGSFMYSVK